MIFGNNTNAAFVKFTQNAFRVAFGLMFMQHGVRKLFGWLTETDPYPLVSQMGLAGILETFGGLLLVLGLFTRPVAALLAVQMLWAYLQAHIGNGLVPILNGGELAILFMFAFAYIAAHGGGSISVDAKLASKR